MDLHDSGAILSRICPHAAEDLDDLLLRFEATDAPRGADLFPPIEAPLLPDIRFKRPDAICVGLRVTDELADAPDRAMRLAAMAIERDAEVIVLSQTDTSGLERFGFRVERIAPDHAAQDDAFLQQVRRFWQLDLVL